MHATCAVSLGTLALHSGARAHEPPRGLSLVWTDEAPSALPVVLTNRGLVFPAWDAADGHFRLRCNEAYGVNTAARSRLFADSAGRLVLATHASVSNTQDHGCSWQSSAGIPDATLGRPIQHEQAQNQLLLTTVDVDPGSTVLASDDHGASWSVRGNLGPGRVYTALAWAPSDAQRVYASGLMVDEEQAKVVWLWARSSDGGQTFDQTSLEEERKPLAVHPTDPEIVFAYELSDPLADRYRVLRSQDAGASFEQVLEVSAITSFAASPDGSELWLGAGREGGLYRSNDSGSTFERVYEAIQEVGCLHYRAGKLWVCANMLPNVDGVWTTDDGGESFETVLTFDQVTEPVMCAEPAAADVCSIPWLDWQREILAPLAPDPDAGAGDAGSEADAGLARDGGVSAGDDASVPPPSRPPESEGCAIGRPARSTSTWLLPLVAFALLCRRAWSSRCNLRRDRGGCAPSFRPSNGP